MLVAALAGNSRRLAQIVRAHVERARIYANFITRLSPSIEGDRCDGMEAQWRNELT
jgi:hypothetical protein